MRKRLLRYLGALIVSTVATYSGLARQAVAETAPACGLSDVSAWQVAMEDPQEEATPAYVLRTTEDFIARCPQRPEIPEAHRIAGLAAAWAEETGTAASHFEAAGDMRDTEALLMHAAVRFALGEPERATALRDDAITLWTARIARRGLADIETERLPHGEIIKVSFDRTDPETQLSHLWIARPDGPGWPAALAVSSRRQLNAFHQLRAGEDAPALRHVRLYRCETRRLLARSTERLSDREIDAAARLGLSAYLADPDIPGTGALRPCVFDGDILPAIHPARAVPTQ
ncbi:hypothetical protein [Henriciella aquimarina]|uniref:hypothetical protein n=1 Tax=Henriciella aquimarina TaxID=545261 RepID=UPI0009FD3A24|nr:hypothetical protein [Henriciella aquimarina]